VRRIGVLLPVPADDQNGRDRVAAFRQALQAHEGLNVRIDTRAAGDREVLDQYAAELITLAPDVILAGSGLATEILQQATRTVPSYSPQQSTQCAMLKALADPAAT
jgi:putative ABC transport system substrate-binding protein